MSEHMAEIQRSLGRIEGKLDNFDERFDRQFDRTASVEKRVGALEGWRKWMMGAQAAVLAVFAVLVRVLK